MNKHELKYKHLFEPISIAGTLFKNRLMVAPVGYLDTIGTREHGYYHIPEAAAYYERKAAGGASTVVVGSCYVDRKYGDFGDYHVFLDDPHSIHSFYDVANAITRHGAVASAEIIHCGLYSNRMTGEPSYGPVAMEDNGRPVYEMDEEYILSLIDRFASAAAAAKKCGFNMVTIHGGHGWLISQFVNPKLNTRKDRWGGAPIENRARLPVEICKAIRKNVGPNFPIEIRISGSEVYEGGYGIDEGIALSKQLDGYADLIHVSAGSHERDEVFTVTHPSMFMDEGCNSIYAAEIKKNVSKSKVVTVGAFSGPELMEDVIASGKADFISLGRAVICDPDLPVKLRSGSEEEVIKCMRCLSCFSNMQTYGKVYCAINPKSGREYTEKFNILPVKNKKKVLVVGGGIGGMQSAITCAERGHTVILCEKESRLGGALRCEEKVPFKRGLSRYLDVQEHTVISNPSIAVHLGCEIKPESAAEFGADAVIVSIGARPVIPPVSGIVLPDGAHPQNVIGAREAFIDPEKVGNTVVILGGGLVGVELGIFLAQSGRSVTIIELLDSLNNGGNHLHAKGLAVELNKYGIGVNLNTMPLEITDAGVLAESGGIRKMFPADTVIYAIGYSPLQDEAKAFYACAKEFYVLGDCISPRNITNATSAAYEISRSIGVYI